MSREAQPSGCPSDGPRAGEVEIPDLGAAFDRQLTSRFLLGSDERTLERLGGICPPFGGWRLDSGLEVGVGCASMEGTDLRAETVQPRYATEAIEEREPARVLDHLQQLSVEVDDFSKALDRIENRLTPVLGPESPHAMLQERVDSVPQSHLANSLESHWQWLHELTSQLHRLTDRIEV